MAEGTRRPRYHGEDVTPTSKRELLGWYTYGLAAEVFAVCGAGSFLPVTLEQLAREQGVLLSDGVTPCVSPIASGAGNSTVSNVHGLLTRAAKADHGQCIVHLLGTQVNTASFAMYTFSIAVLVQVLVLISFSSMADYGNNRKTLLVIFGLIGSTASMLFLLITPPIYLIGSVLTVVGIASMGASFVMLNSFLPLLAANHPSLYLLENEHGGAVSSIALDSLNSDARCPGSPNEARQPRTANGTSNAGTIPRLNEKKVKMAAPELKLSAQISARGIGIGYTAAVFVQCLSILLLYISSKTSLSKASGKTLPLRLVLFLVGVWWFIFTVVSRYWLRNRPGPSLNTLPSGKVSIWRSWIAHVVFTWTSLWKTLKMAFRLPQVLLFLVAWALLSDGTATISGTAILFAKTELDMATTSIALLSITATTAGIAGAFSWPIISRWLGLQPNKTIIACVLLLEIIPLYGLLGYLPFLQAWGVGGLQQPWEIFPLGFIHGFAMGGISSYCRSFFGLLIPPGSEASFYALFAMTDKGSSIFGPAIVGVIVDATGHIRPAFIFLVFLIILPAPLIWMVDVERGRGDGIRMAENMRKSKDGDVDADAFALEGEEEAEGLLEDSD